ncbi:MAG: hypothetical protein MPJ24_00545 [Pirellulaceae bacterium]|nr:hypothetical protein [Pirellulaceae bacterium]
MNVVSVSEKWPRQTFFVLVAFFFLLLLVGSQASDRTLELLKNTTLLIVAVLGISLPVGIFLAATLFHPKTYGRKFLLLGFAALLVVPLYLQVAGWNTILATYGWYHKSTLALLIPLPFLEGWLGTVWVHSLHAIGWNLFFIGWFYHHLPGRLEEQALLEVPPHVVFWKVTLPQLRIPIVAASLWNGLILFTEISVTDLYQVNTYAREIYVGFALGENIELYQWQTVADGGIVLLGSVLGAIFLRQLFIVDPKETPLLLSKAGFRKSRTSEGSWVNRVFGHLRFHWRALLCWFAFCIMFVLPMCSLAYHGGIVVILGEEQKPLRFWGFTRLMENMWNVLFLFRMQFFWSFLVSAVSSFLAVSVGALLGWVAVHAKGKRLFWAPWIIWGTLAFLLSIPGPLLGLGTIDFFNRWALLIPALGYFYDYTIVPLVLVSFLKSLPISYLICWYRFRMLPVATLEAAKLDGLGVVATFWHLGVRQSIGAIVLTWGVAYWLAWSELTTSILVAPPGIETLPIRIFGLLHSGADDQVAAVCLWVVVIALVALGFGYLISGGGRKKWQTGYGRR